MVKFSSILFSLKKLVWKKEIGDFRQAKYEIIDPINEKTLEVLVTDGPEYRNLTALERVLEECDRCYFLGRITKKENSLRLIPYKNDFIPISEPEYLNALERVEKNVRKLKDIAKTYNLTVFIKKGPLYWVVLLVNPHIKILYKIPFLLDRNYKITVYLPDRYKWLENKRYSLRNFSFGVIKNDFREILEKSRQDKITSYMPPLYPYIIVDAGDGI